MFGVTNVRSRPNNMFSRVGVAYFAVHAIYILVLCIILSATINT